MRDCDQCAKHRIMDPFGIILLVYCLGALTVFLMLRGGFAWAAAVDITGFVILTVVSLWFKASHWNSVVRWLNAHLE